MYKDIVSIEKVNITIILTQEMTIQSAGMNLYCTSLIEYWKKLQFSYLSMQGNNIFRKSDSSIRGLDSILCQQTVKKLRNSLTNNSISALDFSSYRTTVSNQCIPLPNYCSNNPTNKKSQTNLNKQLISIQDKLNKAKSQLSLNIHKFDKNSPIKNNDSKTQTNKTVLYELSPNKNSTNHLKTGKIQKFTNIMPKPKNVFPFIANPYNSSSIRNNQYYISQSIRAINEKNSLAVQHIQTSIVMLKHCAQSFENNRYLLAQQQKIIVKRDPTQKRKKTLVLDLDETLIHCFQTSECEPHLKLKTTIQNIEIDIQLLIRPYALTFLKRIQKKWQVIIFTASHENYANVILDQIDPDHLIISHRLYRQHCTQIGDMYIKDLSRLNRDLSQVVLVDNAAYSYALQLDNGIPILPYYDGKDYQLSALQNYLGTLEGCSDVRLINKDYFKLHRYTQFSDSRQLIGEIYQNKI